MTSPARPASGRWLFGPAWDLLLGCGLFYGIVIGVIALFGSELRPYNPHLLIPLLVILVSMPHYGGTLVRIYDQREERRAYAIFSVWITLALGACFVWGLASVLVSSILLTIYLTWSPWHYTGQNYGIAVMFLRRRMGDIPPLAKRLLYASFALSFVLTFLVMHGSGEAVAYNPFAYEGREIRMLSLGIPKGLAFPLFVGAGVTYLLTLAAAGALLLRRGSLGDVLPAAALCLTQALWFSAPFAAAFLGIRTGIVPIDEQLGNREFVYLVALGHAVQYLWVTAYYARHSRGWHGYAAYLGKVLAAGIAVWTLPAVVFAPDRLGSFEYATGLALLIAAIVNIHHFILDGAIWKLRNTRVASVLIRPREASGDAAESRSGRWLPHVVWAIASAGAVIALASFWLDRVSLPNAYREGDYARAASVLDRMAWFGRDDSRWRRRVADRLLGEGKPELALHSYERVADLEPPNAESRRRLAFLAARIGDREAEVRYRREALRLDPKHTANASSLAWILATSRDPRARDPDEALRIAEALVQDVGKPDAALLDTLAAAYAAGGRFPDAVRTARAAEEIARAQEQEDLGARIHSRLDLYRDEHAYVEGDVPAAKN